MSDLKVQHAKESSGQWRFDAEGLGGKWETKDPSPKSPGGSECGTRGS